MTPTIFAIVAAYAAVGVVTGWAVGWWEGTDDESITLGAALLWPAAWVAYVVVFALVMVARPYTTYALWRHKVIDVVEKDGVRVISTTNGVFVWSYNSEKYFNQDLEETRFSRGALPELYSNYTSVDRAEREKLLTTLEEVKAEARAEEGALSLVERA